MCNETRGNVRGDKRAEMIMEKGGEQQRPKWQSCVNTGEV